MYSVKAPGRMCLRNYTEAPCSRGCLLTPTQVAGVWWVCCMLGPGCPLQMSPSPPGYFPDQPRQKAVLQAQGRCSRVPMRKGGCQKDEGGSSLSAPGLIGMAASAQEVIESASLPAAWVPPPLPALLRSVLKPQSQDVKAKRAPKDHCIHP